MAELWAPLLSLCSNPAGPSVSAGRRKVLYQNSQRCVWVTAGDIPPLLLAWAGAPQSFKLQSLQTI